MATNPDAAEIQELRELLAPALALRSGHSASAAISDDEFAGRLRRRLTVLTGGVTPLGFHCSCSRTLTGEFSATLSWLPHPERETEPLKVFSAHGKTEALALLRAAAKLVHDDEFRELLFQSG